MYFTGDDNDDDDDDMTMTMMVLMTVMMIFVWCQLYWSLCLQQRKDSNKLAKPAVITAAAALSCLAIAKRKSHAA